MKSLFKVENTTVTAPCSDSQMTRFNAYVDELISVLKSPAIWRGHQPVEIVSGVLEVLLATLRQNCADSVHLQSRSDDLLNTRA